MLIDELTALGQVAAAAITVASWGWRCLRPSTVRTGRVRIDRCGATASTPAGWVVPGRLRICVETGQVSAVPCHSAGSASVLLLVAADPGVSPCSAYGLSAGGCDGPH